MRRDRWENIAFRVLCRRACELTKACYRALASQVIHEQIQHYFTATSWLIPYPTPTKFIQRNKQRKLYWVAIFYLPDIRSGGSNSCETSPRSFLPPIEQAPSQEQSGSWTRQKEVLAARQYLADWDLQRGESEPIMTRIAVDWDTPLLQYNADIHKISEHLEHEWQIWRQVQDTGENKRGGQGPCNIEWNGRRLMVLI